MLLVKRLTENAILPVRGSKLAAGYDLSAAEAKVVPAHGKALVKTDLAIATPLDCYARIAPRSGLAWKKHIDVGAGVVDADYRGNVGVILFNFGDADFEVAPGDRVAQLILEKIAMAEVEDVGDAELPDTARGAGGFGSTGVAGASKAAAIDATTSTSTSTSTSSSSASEEAPKRAKTVGAGDSADSPLLPMAEMLVFINTELPSAGVEWATVKPELASFADAKPLLKARALASDEKLFAAMQAFQATGDAADLAETLKLIMA
jgi:dUTP pyrophosphatase